MPMPCQGSYIVLHCGPGRPLESHGDFWTVAVAQLQVYTLGCQIEELPDLTTEPPSTVVLQASSPLHVAMPVPYAYTDTQDAENSVHSSITYDLGTYACPPAGSCAKEVVRDSTLSGHCSPSSCSLLLVKLTIWSRIVKAVQTDCFSRPQSDRVADVVFVLPGRLQMWRLPELLSMRLREDS